MKIVGRQKVQAKEKNFRTGNQKKLLNESTCKELSILTAWSPGV